MKYLSLYSAILLSLNVFGQDDFVNVGQEIPTFNISLDSGQVISSTSLKGKVTFINFFATWCGPCVAELPLIDISVWGKYKSNPNFKMLVIGRGHTDSEVKEFKATHHFNLPMYPDANKEIYSLFATKYIPRSYIIDKSGKVVYTSSGYEKNEFDKMLNVLDKLLK
jgi:peroxiredoxin